jgi:hypothetical protein
VREALEELAILTEKLTHIPRIFAAQLLIAMGLRVEDVPRAGGWLKDCLGTAYIIFSLSPDGLLALAMWRKDGSDYQCFGDPRFHIAVSDDLLYHALPQLKTFREKADAAVQAALEDGAPAALKQPALTASQMARVLTVATIARIQDAVATADQYPDNPFNADMMGHPDFRCALVLVMSTVTVLVTSCHWLLLVVWLLSTSCHWLLLVVWLLSTSCHWLLPVKAHSRHAK